MEAWNEKESIFFKTPILSFSYERIKNNVKNALTSGVSLGCRKV